MVENVSGALVDKIQDGAWKDEARNFGKHVRTMCDMMDALDCGIDADDYPRAMYEATRILENDEGGQQQADTTRAEGEEQ